MRIKNNEFENRSIKTHHDCAGDCFYIFLLSCCVVLFWNPRTFCPMARRVLKDRAAPVAELHIRGRRSVIEGWRNPALVTYGCFGRNRLWSFGRLIIIAISCVMGVLSKRMSSIFNCIIWIVCRLENTYICLVLLSFIYRMIRRICNESYTISSLVFFMLEGLLVVRRPLQFHQDRLASKRSSRRGAFLV